MIMLDRPYISDFLKETIRANRYPVIETEAVEEFGLDGSVPLVAEAEAVKMVRDGKAGKIYTASENSIGWIVDNLDFTELPEKIRLFKDKVKFRKMLEAEYPAFFFRELKLDELDEAPVETFPKPFVVKPAVGFFSLGVNKVSSDAQWPEVVKSIRADISAAGRHYNTEVLDGARFIVEEEAEGEEFAIDAYYGADGEPVITGILKHIFASGDDVSDRVYFTSAEVIGSNLERFTEFLEKIGELAGLTNFPLHVEVRVDKAGSLVPIEINPMRFGAWCTTADLAWYAYGFNPYIYYFEGKRPDWKSILDGREGRIYSLILLDNSTGIDGSAIESFDYEGVLSRLEKPITLRKIDFKEYPVFGFVFAESSAENFSELEELLKSDLSEFIKIKERD